MVDQRQRGLSYFRLNVDMGLEDVGITGRVEELAGITGGYLRKAEPDETLTNCAKLLAGQAPDPTSRASK
jgi:hypothetical protein